MISAFQRETPEYKVRYLGAVTYIQFPSVPLTCQNPIDSHSLKKSTFSLTQYFLATCLIKWILVRKISTRNVTHPIQYGWCTRTTQQHIHSHNTVQVFLHLLPWQLRCSALFVELPLYSNSRMLLPRFWSLPGSFSFL